jgi:hypothetical protein
MMLQPLDPHFLQILAVSMPYAPKADNQSQSTSPNCYHISTSVTTQSFVALPLAARKDDAVRIVHDAIKKVKDVAGNHGSKSHATPVLAKAMNAKCLGDDRRVDSEKETVSKTCQPRHKLEVNGILDTDCTKLCRGEDERRDDEAP